MICDDIVSVVIATFNSADKLPRTLEALSRQSYPQELMEILIIDGGSTDKTREIASRYGCRIIDNKKTEPVHAKLLGVQNAKGKYLVTLDHDEVLVNPKSIEIRVQALHDNPECKVALCSGYACPSDYPRLNQYISEFGDPFSYFIYRYSKDHTFFMKRMNKDRGKCKEEETYLVKSFDGYGKMPIFELVCLATMIDLEWFRENTEIARDPRIMVHLFYIMLERGYKTVVISKNDELVHYSADSIKGYLPKLKWRICNNIHHDENGENGFSGRMKYQRRLKYKKYLFVPYTILCVFPIVDGVYLSISRRNPIYLIHFLLCWYVLYQIVLQYILKIVGRKPHLKSYDGKKIIE